MNRTLRGNGKERGRASRLADSSPTIPRRAKERREKGKKEGHGLGLPPLSLGCRQTVDKKKKKRSGKGGKEKGLSSCI